MNLTWNLLVAGHPSSPVRQNWILIRFQTNLATSSHHRSSTQKLIWISLVHSKAKNSIQTVNIFELFMIRFSSSAFKITCFKLAMGKQPFKLLYIAWPPQQKKEGYSCWNGLPTVLTCATPSRDCVEKNLNYDSTVFTFYYLLQQNIFKNMQQNWGENVGKRLKLQSFFFAFSEKIEEY